MHDIWNPWHGCRKISEGCAHCYVYYQDGQRGGDGSRIYRTKAGFDYPLQRKRDGGFRIQAGELIRVCMTSDFFLEEADAWRPEAWDIMRQRPDVKFFLLTKRAGRIARCLPPDWGDGWPNVMLNVTAENQRRADERLPILMGVPARHKGVMCAPFVGPVSLQRWLGTGQIEQVACGGENYDGSRPCRYEWVRGLYEECVAANVRFAFLETGNAFVKDGRTYHFSDKQEQRRQAWRSGLRHEGRPIEWDLRYPIGIPVPPEDLYVPRYRCDRCQECGGRMICNGCGNCGGAAEQLVREFEQGLAELG